MNPGDSEWLDLQSKLHVHVGPQLAVMAALFGLGRSAGVQELTDLTPLSHPTVLKALRALDKVGLAQKHGYHKGWMLTAKARQLSFFGGDKELERNLQVEGPLERNLQVGGGSSGLCNELIDSYIQTTTTPPDLKDLQVARHNAVQSIVSMGGTSPKTAEKAIQRAEERGDDLAIIERRIAACAAYIAAEAVPPKWPGAWTAGLIGGSFDPPSPAGQSYPQAVDKYAGYLNPQLDERESLHQSMQEAAEAMKGSEDA